MKMYAAYFVLVLTVCCYASLPSGAQMRKMYQDNTTEDNDIHDLGFYSPSEGYIAFDDWIGYTNDSGRTFTRRYIAYSNVDYNNQPVNLTFGFHIQGVQAFNQSTLVAYGHYGWVPAILYSNNGGVSFKLVFHSLYTINQFKTGITDMVFPQNGLIGYAVDADRVLKTVNGGLSWSVIKVVPDAFFDHLEAVDNNNLIAFSKEYYSNQVLKTADGGATWQKLHLPVGRISYVYFLTVAKGWLSIVEDNKEKFYTTNDGGMSWIQLNDTEGTPFSCSKMHFVDTNTGYALRGLYTVYKTTDGGKIWERIPRDNSYGHLNYSHNDLQVWSASQLWAGGGQGFLELSTNGGGTLVPQSYFKIDTANLYQTGRVNLVNYSRPGYQYKWYKNDTLISTSFSTSYTHNEAIRLDSIKLVVTNNGQSDSTVRYMYFNPTVVIASFSPSTAGYGMTVNITGRNFSQVTGISFGGTPALRFQVISPTQINAVVGDGSSGNVTVNTFGGSGTLPGFRFIPPLNVYTPASITDSILCKSEPVRVMLQNAEPEVRYDLVNDKGITCGSVISSGGTVILYSNPINKTGIYRIRATRLNIVSSAYLAQNFFIKVEQTKSSFTSDKVNIIPGDTVHYFPSSYEASSYIWSFEQDASLKTSTESYPPAISYNSTGQKMLTLISVSPNGCRDTVRANAVYVYQKPATDDICYISNLDSAMTFGHSLRHLNKTVDNGFLLTAQTIKPSSLYSRYGSSKLFPLPNTSYVANYSTNGVLRWTCYFENGDGAVANAVTDEQGNVYLVGWGKSTKYFHLNHGDSLRFWAQPEDTISWQEKTNGFILKLDPEGRYIWHTMLYDFTPAYSGYGYLGVSPSKIKIRGNHIVVTGDFRAKLSYWRKGSSKTLYDLQNSVSARDNQNNFVIKIDANGNLLWRAGFFNEAVNAYSLSDVSIDSQGNSYYIGTYENSVQLRDADSVTAMSLQGLTAYFRGYVVKLTAGGKVSWYNDARSGHQYGDVGMIAITTDGEGNSYTAGRVMNWGQPGEVVVIKNNGRISRDSVGGYTVLKFDPNGNYVWGVGARDPYYGRAHAIQLVGNELFVAGTASLNGIPKSSFLFTSTDKQYQNIEVSQSEFFMVNYDTAGRLRRVIKSGDNQYGYINPADFFVDAQNNFFIGGNSDVANGGTDNSNVFGLTLHTPSSGDGFFTRLNSSYCYTGILPPANAGPDMVKCAGYTSQIGTEAEAGNSYYWTSQPAGFTSTLARPIVAPLVNTTYYLTVINAAGFMAKDTVSINTLASPVADAGADQAFCKGNSATLGSPPVPGNSYSWSSKPSGFTSTEAAPSVNPTVTTTYYLTVKNDIGCSQKDTVVVQVTNPVEPNITIGGSLSFCAGYIAKYMTGVTNGGSSPSYQWQVNGMNVGSDTSVYNSATLVTGDQVRVILTSSATCITRSKDTSSTITVTVHQTVTPSVSITASSGATCQGTNVAFTATPVNGGTSPYYQWQINGVNAGTNSSIFSSTQLKNNDKVRVIMTSNAACPFPSKDTSNILSTSVESADTGPDKTICKDNGGTTIGTPAISGYSYAWTPLNGLNSGVVAQPTANPSATTTYYLTVTAPSGCIAKDTVTVTILQPPLPPVVTVNSNLLTSSAVWGNQWYKDGVLIPNATAQTYTATDNGMYTARVSNGLCTSQPSNAINFTTTAINSPVLNEEFLIGPNPMQHKLFLQYKGNNGRFRAELLDVTGNVIFEQKMFTISCEFNVKNLSAGSYVLRVINEKNNEQIQRLIIKL